MRRTAAIVTIAAGLLLPAGARGEDVPVDLELVLAVDVSQSVDPREGQLQRLGYIRALENPRVIEAIRAGANGRIAVTYMEWAGPGLWRDTADWHLIASAEDASAFTAVLEDISIARGVGTSITSAITQAARKFDGNGFAGERLVIDISGDGPNSSGGLVTRARDAAVAAGIVINGVAINNADGSPFTLPDLDVYYSECVIGGPGSFVVPVADFDSFADAILRKLILEIAGGPEPRPIGYADRAKERVVPVQAEGLPRRSAGPKYGPACDIGERQRLMDNPSLRLDELLRGIR